ncbi:tail completion protein gp17 [Sphingomonas silueang]|uniref:tail completion protein gp17 n=1 Tax=Sphingomonas silueang TaxID=3156617 RepID=UPI0032B3EFA9
MQARRADRVEEALRALLLSTAPLAALVGRRVDWGLRPQGDPLPGLTLQRISDAPVMNLAGPSGWSRARIQLDAWGRTFKEARDIGDLLAGRGGLLVGLRRDVAGIRLRGFVVVRRSGTDSTRTDPIHRDSIDLMLTYTAL